jgi:NDP-hexose-3-ketoreductase
MTDLRVAVWGLGPHAQKNIVPALAACPGIRLQGVCSRNAEAVTRMRAVASCGTWRDPEAMLADPDVDVVYVSTPTGLHAEHGRAVIGAGKHLWVEKSAAKTSAETDALVAASRERGVTFAEGMMFLYHPQFRQLQAIIASDRIRPVVGIGCRFGIPRLERPGFREDPALGGSALLDVGCYGVAASLALLGGDDPTVAFAAVRTAPGSRVDTDGRAVLQHQSGVDVLLEWRTNGAYRNEIDVWGVAGSVFTDRIFSKPPEYVPLFRIRDQRGHESTEHGQAANHFVSMFSAFRDLLGDSRAAERVRQDIAQRARVIDAVRVHAATGAM